ncbi:hypothetical protein [Streptosporangium saharense]
MRDLLLQVLLWALAVIGALTVTGLGLVALHVAVINHRTRRRLAREGRRL